MKNRPDDKILDIFLHQMRQRLGDHLKQIILFGSRARGDFDTDSDYDCLVVVDEVSPLVEKTADEVAAELLYHYDAVFSILLLSVDRYQHDTFEPLLINVRQEGLVL